MKEKLKQIEIAKKAHEFRISLGLCKIQSEQSLKIELEHIEDPKLSEGRKHYY
jgi:hypothetical protein